MSREIIKKEYCRIEFRLASPLSVGSGNNELTDKDIVKKRNKEPYIPGSGIAGATRNSLTSLPKAEQEKYFGFVHINKDTSGKSNNKVLTAENSRVLFYDARILKEDLDKCYVTKRDCVALDEYKTALPGKKFDMEILEPGIHMVTFVEQNFYDDTDISIIDLIEKAWLQHSISFGSKTMRGHGDVDSVRVKKRIFRLKGVNDSEIDEFVEFDMYDDSCWKQIKAAEEREMSGTTDGTILIKLNLIQNGGISIRRYSTNISKDKVQPDYEQLTIHENTKSPIPVVPGTSWAGAFRHCMSQWLDTEQIEDLFGYVKEKEKLKRISKISFSETQLVGAREKILSRNAIDRFSGGTVKGALFTEKTYYSGRGDLCITLKGNTTIEQRRALCAAITDLHMGYLAVGGETSIGRGLFCEDCVTIINGDNRTIITGETGDSLYKKLEHAMNDGGRE